MPELPEVQTAVNYLNRFLPGRSVLNIDTYKRIDSSLEDISVVGEKISKVHRHGKYIAVSLENGFLLCIHLKISGSLTITSKDEDLPRFCVYKLDLSDGNSLCLIDPRKFISLTYFASEDDFLDYISSRVGKDALEINEEELFAKLKKDKRPIKIALMDQNNVAGMGNIYCNEALFDAKLSPMLPACKVRKEDLAIFLGANKFRMETAIVDGIKMGEDLHFHPEEGWMDISLNVYQKDNTPCPNCRAPIKRIELGGRGTYFCPRCQKHNDAPFVIGVTGPIHSGKSSVACMLEKDGYIHFDADKVAHQFYDTEEGKALCLRLLGGESIKDGKVDLSMIRNRLGNDKSFRKSLQNAVFSYVRKQARALIKSCGKDESIVLNVPLLVASKMDKLCDYILLVDSPASLRKNRLELEGRDAESLMKINSNYPIQKTKEVADCVLHNDSSLDELRSKLTRLGLLK